MDPLEKGLYVNITASQVFFGLAHALWSFASQEQLFSTLRNHRRGGPLDVEISSFGASRSVPVNEILTPNHNAKTTD